MTNMSKDIESSIHNILSTSPKSSPNTAFSDKGLYNNFALSINKVQMVDKVDLDDDLIGDNSNDEVSGFMDQRAKDYGIEFEPLDG